MEVKKYNPFVVIETKGSTHERSSKPKPRPKPKVMVEARGLALENKKKLDIIYAKIFVNTNKK